MTRKKVKKQPKLFANGFTKGSMERMKKNINQVQENKVVGELKITMYADQYVSVTGPIDLENHLLFQMSARYCHLDE